MKISMNKKKMMNKNDNDDDDDEERIFRYAGIQVCKYAGMQSKGRHS